MSEPLVQPNIESILSDDSDSETDDKEVVSPAPEPEPETNKGINLDDPGGVETDSVTSEIPSNSSDNSDSQLNLFQYLDVLNVTVSVLFAMDMVYHTSTLMVMLILLKLRMLMQTGLNEQVFLLLCLTVNCLKVNLIRLHKRFYR